MKQMSQTFPLDDLLDVQNGHAFNSKLFSEAEGMQLIRIRDLKSGSETKTRYTGDYDEKFVVKRGDFLIGMDGEFGCYEWVGVDSLLNQRVCRLQNFKENLFPRFLFYGINKYLKDIEDVTSFTTVKHISSKQIKRITFPLPPLSEQKRIVDKLDQAFVAIDEAKANVECNLHNAKDLFKSQLSEIFSQKGSGWVEGKFIELVDASCPLSYGIVQPGGEYLDGLPVVRPTDLTSRIIKAEGLKRIDPRLAEGYKRTILKGGDLLLCVRGSTGVISIAEENLKGANVTRGIVPILFNSSIIEQKFGFYLLISPNIQNQIKAKTYGTALMQINIGDLRQLTMTFPSISDQLTTIKLLDNLWIQSQAAEINYQQELDSLDELKKSLLQQAFNGDL
jgi:type I restriction enzyme, S subunit